ncbi:SPFH domain-containing protein [Carnobacterium gallinarum]|uniref:SPFH domain-containing protein n=1 Tax=Carnobacterium gallinarum TaxID=2749 RepID=UPI0005553E14|nr:SPFH domain-containing protein [Carnobacterium gallinarum]
MGLIKVALTSASDTLADQWLEVIEPDKMSDSTVFVKGVHVRKSEKRGANQKGTSDTISTGSVIHVNPNQFMILTDGGKIVDFTAEEGYYHVDDTALPSLFTGNFKDAIADSFDRIKFGGVTPTKQEVFYINLQEIKGIRFGTRNPINYFDNFYNAELFLRAHGSYSIKITDPILFYKEAIPRNKVKVDIQDINEQYLNEFLEALQASINQLSADGERVSHVTSKGTQLSKFMSETLDEEWRVTRGMEIQAVGIASISYDDESKALIQMRNQGAMLSDPGVREGYVQGAVARGMEAAGSNPNGSVNGFFAMNSGIQTGGNFVGTTSQANQQQMQNQQNQSQQQPQAETPQVAPQTQVELWTCECGTRNTGKFCFDCGKPKPEPEVAAAKFCSNCGYKIPEGQPRPKFCPECGQPFA